jgi:hypothetical protein
MLLMIVMMIYFSRCDSLQNCANQFSDKCFDAAMSSIADFETKTKQASEEALATNEERCQEMESAVEKSTTKVNKVYLYYTHLKRLSCVLYILHSAFCILHRFLLRAAFFNSRRI